jgi:hypothetical protein
LLPLLAGRRGFRHLVLLLLGQQEQQALVLAWRYRPGQRYPGLLQEPQQQEQQQRVQQRQARGREQGLGSPSRPVLLLEVLLLRVQRPNPPLGVLLRGMLHQGLQKAAGSLGPGGEEG